MKKNISTLLILVFLTSLLSSCGELSGGIEFPSMEVPLRDFSSRQPEPIYSPTATQEILPKPSSTQPNPQLPISTSTITPLPYPLWIDPSVPKALRESVSDKNLPVAESASTASLQLGLGTETEDDANQSKWIYSLVAPFPTVLDGVTLTELTSAWSDSSNGPFNNSPLWMTESTYNALSSIFGEAGEDAVKILPAEDLVDALWESQPTWGIVPFESLDPKLKVLSVDGQSPVRNDFDESAYPLIVNFELVGTMAKSFELPVTNRDPSKLSVVLVTGVTALVRATAIRMEIAGLDYPAWNIGDILKAADITHISNEIPFFSGCPYPDPRQEDLVFCSNPKYIELLEIIGTDVVELTGNHFQDYGSEATLQTLELYDERGWPYYGGGKDLEDSRKPALLTHNGNRFAFIGCNTVGPEFAWASQNRPGAAPCRDFEWMKDEIIDLTERGYIVIATFQYIEYYQAIPTEKHVIDFQNIAETGATIVSGSQAHIPQAMEFYKESFIHYGLGNLFFDQMNGPSRREFLDRHVFYEGRYISTELVTAMLEDYARPRPMRKDEREGFLQKMFEASSW